MYKIKIEEPTLRELMLIISLYTCKTISEVTALVHKQNKPILFFKVFLELEMKPLISYLAFDRHSIGYLCSDVSKAKLSRDMLLYEFPIFYKNSDERSAIDIALSLN